MSLIQNEDTEYNGMKNPGNKEKQEITRINTRTGKQRPRQRITQTYSI